jgi:hypothetical protein
MPNNVQPCLTLFNRNLNLPLFGGGKEAAMSEISFILQTLAGIAASLKIYEFVSDRFFKKPVSA